MFFMKNPSPLATGILYWSIVTLLGLGLGTWVIMAETATSASTRGGIGLTTHLRHDRQGVPDHRFGLRRTLAVGLHHQAQHLAASAASS